MFLSQTAPLDSLKLLLWTLSPDRYSFSVWTVLRWMFLSLTAHLDSLLFVCFDCVSSSFRPVFVSAPPNTFPLESTLCRAHTPDVQLLVAALDSAPQFRFDDVGCLNSHIPPGAD
ncbi:hypothetical protein WMY93_031540 [Mugilogobius chulae]|uniref:Uncharacterized protein n=1 Tax=Mugilogobius chulae TaxID=88201 RepID=A0AAW0MFE8_9GOBI